jgi:hypothetical protein
MSNTNTGKQGGAPSLTQNWSAGTPKPADLVAPKGIVSVPIDNENRGKDGTQK